MTNSLISKKCQNCTCMSGPFHHLSEEDLARVDENRSEIKYKKGETMCKQGAFVSYVMFLRKGLVKIYLEGDKELVMLSIAGEGTFLGLPAITGRGIHHYSVEALDDTEVCQVEVSLFQSLLKSNAEFCFEVLQMVNQKLINSYYHLQSVTSKPLPSRFADLILQLSKKIYKQNPFNLTLSRKEMAEMVYSSQESISRLLKEFKIRGLIRMKGNTVEVLDEEKLQHQSEVV